MQQHGDQQSKPHCTWQHDRHINERVREGTAQNGIGQRLAKVVESEKARVQRAELVVREAQIEQHHEGHEIREQQQQKRRECESTAREFFHQPLTIAPHDGC